LAEALKTLMSEPRKLRAMGQAAVEDVTANYSLERMAAVFMEAFDYVRNTKSTRGT
jgi:hypothetical protein